ncbi:NADPH-dependent glutamate synthase [Dehalococcoides mccartyi]|uniref:Dihydropyrimidine dehydrogenase n=1 Tax=Dehalococcoides mccartyi TaxID=61435 RepID=A0A0V8LXZ6_9CHLR|nr:NADPH-dependent glutamate synthase [Dehalococcoides mccartyi]KSV16304.1 dihydropyrimidine dehydrogenase [Dehalococcoides mccartyi]MDN4186268.1 NADPH-dependent glutamate synthase [Dehalococcoides mccartyi]
MAKAGLNRMDMPKQAVNDRIQNFSEVATGYTPADAHTEAARCLQCKKRYCVEGCPVNIDIPEFILALRDGNMPEAARVLKKTNSLPGVCGRVCPQETQCEQACILNKKEAPIAIGRLERFVADWERGHSAEVNLPKSLKPKSGKKAAVVGAGPAGLTAAAELARLGHDVTLFESLHTAGGVLMYGIPEFRLPKDIVQGEIEYVKSLGVTLELNSVAGRLFSLEDLFKQGFQAVFLATGAGLPLFLNVQGENLSGVYSANEFLTRVNLMKAHNFPSSDTPVKKGRKVAVIGGGNVAMDAARCALRLGAEEVSIVYRRSELELPARKEEVDNAREEGIKFHFLTSPVRFLANEQGQVRAMECQKMALGEPDGSGRRRPIPVGGSEFEMDIDLAVIALGTRPNPLVMQSAPDLQVNSNGTVLADINGQTSHRAVWAGGDIVTGSDTVISAMGAAKRSAVVIDEYLRSL